MAIKVTTSDPAALLAAIHAVFGSNNTRPKTWRMDVHKEFTHTPEQWDAQAWFGTTKPAKGDVELVFNFLTYPGKDKPNDSLYPYYHGRFVEMLIAYFSDDIDEIIVLPTPTSLDSLTKD